MASIAGANIARDFHDILFAKDKIFPSFWWRFKNRVPTRIIGTQGSSKMYDILFT